MILISNKQQYYNEINNMSKKKSNYFYIATYNLNIDNNVMQILNNLKKNCKDIKIVIGLSNPSNKQISFLKYKLKDFQIKIFNNSHLKMIVSDTSAIIGGRNLTNSDWKDTGVKFQNKSSIVKLKSEFLKNFNSKNGLL